MTRPWGRPDKNTCTLARSGKGVEALPGKEGCKEVADDSQVTGYRDLIDAQRRDLGVQASRKEVRSPDLGPPRSRSAAGALSPRGEQSIALISAHDGAPGITTPSTSNRMCTAACGDLLRII
ncbi:hypothetical protein KM043_008318 [Ampulex compressa]|nr:hypothetical protein KM043_008318 [Ampulex compressa]